MTVVAVSKKVGNEIRVEGDAVIIRRFGLDRLIEHGFKGEKRIPIGSITAVEYRDARQGIGSKAVWNRGFLQLTIHGGRESRGGVQAARFDENTVGFVWPERASFAAVCDRIEALIAARQTSTQSATIVPTDDADLLRKFAALRDEGLISDEEFEEKKRRLLS